MGLKGRVWSFFFRFMAGRIFAVHRGGDAGDVLARAVSQ